MLENLETPCLLLDRRKLTANIARLRARLAAHGVPLRPHLKTAKSIDVARLALEGQPGGITVSTLHEAEYFLAHGVRDILYAVSIAPAKLARVHALQQRGAAISIIVDDPATASAVASRGAALGTTFPTLIEIDTDGHRAGMPVEGDQLVETARRLIAPGSRFVGVMTHAGQSYNCRTIADIEAMAEQERAGAVRAAERIRGAGLACPVVSVGSTPTAMFARTLDGITEVRAGVYMFQDLVMAELGVCTTDDIAVSVLATVISHNPAANRLVIDAGGLALSKDRGASGDVGYGRVCTADGAPIADMIVAQTNQEHGLVTRQSGAAIAFDRYPIGSQLRVLPNHACMTAAAYDAYIVLDDGRPRARWPRANGWS